MGAIGLAGSPDVLKELGELARTCPSGDPFGERGWQRDIGKLACTPLIHELFKRLLDASDVFRRNNDAGAGLLDQLSGGPGGGNRGEDRTAGCEILE